MDREGKEPQKSGSKEALRGAWDAHLAKVYTAFLERTQRAYKDGWRIYRQVESAAPAGRPVYRGVEYFHPNKKGAIAIEALSPRVRAQLQGHGVGLKIAADQQIDTYAVEALAAILSTGELKGDVGTLDGSTMLFDDAPFVLISNAGEDLVNSSRTRLTGLRTVLVNGLYENMIGDLRKAFPGVSFRTADELNDQVFARKEPTFVPTSVGLQEKIARGEVPPVG